MAVLLRLAGQLKDLFFAGRQSFCPFLRMSLIFPGWRKGSFRHGKTPRSSSRALLSPFFCVLGSPTKIDKKQKHK